MHSEDDLYRLLIGFLSDTITPEERKLVAEWVKEDAKNEKHYQDIRMAWMLTHQKETGATDLNHEWNRFRQLLSDKQTQVLFEGNSEVHTKITTDTRSKTGRRTVYSIIIKSSIAAAVFFVSGYFWNRVLHGVHTPEIIVRSKPFHPEAGPVAVWRQEENNGKTSRRIVLADGSGIVLKPGARLRFQLPFTAGRRDLWLTGEAAFSVARDTAKPFTVYSGDLATTALGTRFTVASRLEAPFIKVALYEGKVVVRSVEQAVKKLSKDFYLRPGQELVYDKASYTVRVRPMGNHTGFFKKNLTAYPVAKEIPALPGSRKGNWYMFNNRPLAEVLDQLQVFYNVRIVYTEKDVRKKYFIGQYESSEPLEKILKQIAVLNDLKLARLNEDFILSR